MHLTTTCAILTSVFFATSARAQQHIVVNTVEDLVDFGGAQQVANLPGPDGLISFREAVAASNNTPGPQTIEFAIPQSGFWPLFPTMAMLKVEQSPGGFVLTDDGTTIDCTSQTRIIGDTNSAGNEVGIYSLMGNFTLPQAGIAIFANNCVVKGLDTVRNFGYGVRVFGNNNRIVGCHIFDPLGGGAVYAAVAIRPISSIPPTGNIIGGIGPGEGNTLACYPGSGIEITGPAEDTIVIGNTLNRSHVAGLLIQAGASGTRVGGTTAAERNVIAGNGTGGSGIPQDCDVLLDGALGTLIEGNFLGTSANGMSAAPTPAAGILVRNSRATTISRNVISGYLQEGSHQGRAFRTGTAIMLTTLPGGASGPTVIQDNLIGVGADAVTPLANAAGVMVSPFDTISMDALIGGPMPGQGNIIAHSSGAGVLISSSASGVRISGNSIFANGAPDLLFPFRTPGIELLDPAGIGGVTANDSGDVDSGGNALQNFPVLMVAQADPGGLRIAGLLESSSYETFKVEFFANSACDPIGNGQGQRFLGSVSVATDGSGLGTFDSLITANVQVGEVITGTATDETRGNTSEFSACRTIVASPCAADFNLDGGVDGQDVEAFFRAWEAGEPRADVDLNGGVDGADVESFFRFWEAGGC